MRTGLPAATTTWTPAAFVWDGGTAKAGGAVNFRGKGWIAEGKNGPRGACRGHHRKRVGLSRRESEGSSSQEIGWSGSFFYTAENMSENKDTVCIFQRERTSPRGQSNLRSAPLISYSEKPYLWCAWLQIGPRVRRGHVRAETMTSAQLCRMLHQKLKLFKLSEGTAPKQDPSGPGAGSELNTWNFNNNLILMRLFWGQPHALVAWKIVFWRLKLSARSEQKCAQTDETFTFSSIYLCFGTLIWRSEVV